MFNDERINAECGKTYKTGILLAVLLTLAYALVRCNTLLMQGTLETIVTYTEAVILLVGAGILIAGAILFRDKSDERIAASSHRFYQKAGKAFIIAVFATYILTIPFTTSEMLGGQAHNHLLLMLEVIGCLYLFYAFKTRRINFNYSFIAEEGSVYYRRVLFNIGGLWLWLFLPFLIAASWELVLHSSWTGALVILVAYISSAIGLSFEYFFLSLVEKTSYDRANEGRFALGTRIAMTVLLVGGFALAVMQCVYVYYATGDLTKIPNIGSFGTAIAVISQQILRMEFVLIVLTGLVISQALSQITPKTRLNTACRVILVLLMLSCFEATVTPITYRAFPEEMLRFYATVIAPAMAYVSYLITLCAWCFLIYGLIKELAMPRFLWAIPVSSALTQGVGIYLTSQNLVRVASFLDQGVRMAGLVLLFVVIWRYRGFAVEGEEEI